MSSAVSWKDLQKVFMPPPPAVVQRSALYQSLPESHLNRNLRDDVDSGVIEFSHGFDASDARRLPSHLARQNIRIRPRSALQPARRRTPSGSTEHVAATSYMLRQARDVERFRRAHRELQAQQAEEREARWAALRVATRRQEETKIHETAVKRHLRLARQVAAQQLRDQHEDERLLCSVDEHRGRCAVERRERAMALKFAIEMWQGVIDRQFAANIQRLIDQEEFTREGLKEDYISELEAKERNFIARIQLLLKTVVLSQEKSSRIALQKVIAVQMQQKAQRDAEINSVLAEERRYRQKICDDEGYRFMDIDGEKYALLQELYREARKRQEERLQQQREHETRLLNDRKDFERIEGEVRSNAARLEEANARAALRNLYVIEKRAANDKARKRIEREALEWQAERKRQLQPIVKENAASRKEVEASEVAARRELSARHTQLLSDLMIPVAVNTGDGSSSRFYFFGPAVPLWPTISFRRKQYTPFANTMITEMTLSVTATGGRTSGDEIDIQAVEVVSARERRQGLRILDGTVLDEDGSALCTVERSAFTAFELATPEDMEKIAREICEDNDPVITLKFANIDREGLAKAVDRCAQALVFRVASTNNSISPRCFVLTVEFSCGPEISSSSTTAAKSTTASVSPSRQGDRTVTLLDNEPKNQLSKSSMLSVSRRHSNASSGQLRKRSSGCFIFTRPFTINVSPPLLALVLPSQALVSRAFIIYDVRRRPETGSGLGKHLYVPVFNAAFRVTDQSRDLAGCVIRIRFTEGYTVDDQLQLPPSESFVLKRDEIKSEGLSVARVVGKLLPAASNSSRDVAIHLADDKPFTAQQLEKLLSRLNYSNHAATPAPHRRVIELTVSDGKKTVSVSATVRVEISMIGTADQCVIVGTEDNPLVVYRDAEVFTPQHLRKHLEPSRAFLFSNATVDVSSALASRDSLPGGYLSAVVSSHAFAWDTISFEAAPSVGGKIIEVAPTKKKEETKLVWYPNASDTSSSVTIGRIKRFLYADGLLRPGVRVDFSECQVSLLQLLIRSLTLTTRGTKETIGVTKTVSAEVCVTDWQATQPPGRKGAVNPTFPTMFCTTVKVLPSVISVPGERPIVVGHSQDAVLLDKLSLDACAMDDIFDGGTMKVEIVHGRSGMEVLSLMAPSSAAAKAQQSSSFRGDASLVDSPEAPQEGEQESDNGGDVTEPSSAAAAPPQTPQQEDLLESFSIVQDPSGNGELHLKKGDVVCGTVTESSDSRLVVAFAGRRRQDCRLDQKADFLKLPILVPGRWVAMLLSRISIQLSEEDPLLLKTISISLEDSTGSVSQCPLQIDIVPIHLPSRIMNVSKRPVFYRASSENMFSSDDAIFLFAPCWIEDDDTTACGKGLLVIEPYQGITDDDMLIWIPSPPPANTSASIKWEDGESRRLAFQPNSADPLKVSISCEGKDVALSVEELLPSGGNRLSVTVFLDTPISVCSLMLQHIGFYHKERFPASSHERQYIVTFNAGDEADVPDTRAILKVRVAPPLIHTLPLYETATFREGEGKTFLFPSLICGCKLSLPILSDVLTFAVSNARDHEDEFQFNFDEDLWREGDTLVCSLDAARSLLGGVVVPTTDFTGVVIGRITTQGADHGSFSFTLNFDDSCILNAALIPALMAKLSYKNISLTPTPGSRNCQLTWRRAETGETGVVKVRCFVEVQGAMTTIRWGSPVISCFEGEDTCCFRGAQLLNEDDTFFERGTFIAAEVVGGDADCTISIPSSGSGSNVATVDGLNVYVKGHLIGELDPLTTTKKLIVNFIDCPMTTGEMLLQNIVFHGNAECSCVLQVSLKADAAAQVPAVNAIQVNIFRRMFDASECKACEFSVATASPVHLFEHLIFRAGVDLGGTTVTAALTSGSAALGLPKGKPVQIGVDRLLLRDLPEHLVLSKGVITNRSSSVAIALCHEKADGTSISVSFPRGAKYSKIAAVQDVLSAIAFDSGAVDAAKSSKASPKRSGSRATSEETSQLSSTTSGGGGPGGAATEQFGSLYCTLTTTRPLESGEIIESVDYAVITIAS